MQPTDTQMLWRHTVLCSNVLGGAEIFTLERMLARGDTPALCCNASLAALIRQDQRYNAIDVRTVPALDALASNISWPNLIAAAAAQAATLRAGGVLLGNLRASAIQLVSPWAKRNDMFVHDNTCYLNPRTRWTIALAGLRSRSLYFPCKHASARLPLRALLTRKLKFEYFAHYLPIQAGPFRLEHTLRIVNVGRIEPNKNQMLAVSIARYLAVSFRQVQLTLLGTVTDEAYAQRLLSATRPENLNLTMLQVLRSEVPQTLRTHDMLLHTSLIESLPLVLFEANAVGVPCFAVDAGGITELLPAACVLPHDAEAAAACVLQQLTASADAPVAAYVGGKPPEEL